MALQSSERLAPLLIGCEAVAVAGLGAGVLWPAAGGAALRAVGLLVLLATPYLVLLVAGAAAGPGGRVRRFAVGTVAVAALGLLLAV